MSLKLKPPRLSFREASDQDPAAAAAPVLLSGWNTGWQMRSSSSGCGHVCHCSRQEVSLVSTSSCCPRTQGPYGALQASAEPGSGWRENGAARRSKDSETLKGLSMGPSPHLQLRPETSHQKTQVPSNLGDQLYELSNEKRSHKYPRSQRGASCYALNPHVSRFLQGWLRVSEVGSNS